MRELGVKIENMVRLFSERESMWLGNWLHCEKNRAKTLRQHRGLEEWKITLKFQNCASLVRTSGEYAGLGGIVVRGLWPLGEHWGCSGLLLGYWHCCVAASEYKTSEIIGPMIGTWKSFCFRFSWYIFVILVIRFWLFEDKNDHNVSFSSLLLRKIKTGFIYLLNI